MIRFTITRETGDRAETGFNRHNSANLLHYAIMLRQPADEIRRLVGVLGKLEFLVHVSHIDKTEAKLEP